MEEIITGMHLLSIAEEYSDFVITKKFSRREEKCHDICGDIDLILALLSKLFG